jgi:hypothetical protein
MKRLAIPRGKIIVAPLPPSPLWLGFLPRCFIPNRIEQRGISLQLVDVGIKAGMTVAHPIHPLADV